MSAENETTKLRMSEAWTIQPTLIERRFGRLLRGPEGDPPPPDPSLISDPPADPPVDPPKPADPPADPAKPADPPKPPESPAAVEPITVEALTLPEGLELPAEKATELLEILNGDKSPLDRANALIALHGKTLLEASEASSKLWDNMQTEWKDAVKADPDIGGAKLQPTLTNVGKLLDEFGSGELKSVFDLTGAGNNIHMIKFLDKIANVLTEGKFFKAGSPAGSDDPNAAAARLFPTMKG